LATVNWVFYFKVSYLNFFLVVYSTLEYALP